MDHPRPPQVELLFTDKGYRATFFKFCEIKIRVRVNENLGKKIGKFYNFTLHRAVK